MRCILHSPGPKCRGGPGEEGKRYRAGRASAERNGLHFCKSSSPAVILLCPMGGCHGDRRPHVLGVSFWSKDPIVLVLSRLQYARLPGTGASHPSRTHTLPRSLSQTTHPTPTHIIEVQQFGFNSINCTFTKMIQVLKETRADKHTVSQSSRKTHTHTRA